MIRRSKKYKEDKKFYRINERIFASTLRVLDVDGKQVGIIPRYEALSKAKELGLDLVEIAPMASPPVAKIIDFRKFLYQEAKKQREEKKKSKTSETKEIRLGPFMNDHDLDVMIKRASDFLEEGNKVKLVLKFKGRQITHPEFGTKIINQVINKVADVSKLERDPRFEGKQLIAMLSPERRKNKKDEKKNQEIDKQTI